MTTKDDMPAPEDFRLIADCAPVPMWVTALDRSRAFVNRAYRDFLALDDAAALAFDWRTRIHPDDVDRVVRESIAGEAALQPFALEFRYVRGDGEIRWIRSISQPRWDASGSHAGFIGVAYDQTEARVAEQQSRAREEQLAAFIDQATAGFAQVDLTGRFTLVNDRFCAITGRSRDALMTLTMQAITHPDDLAANVPMFDRAVSEGTPYAHEKRYVRPDGSIVWVNNSVSVIRAADGTPSGVLAVTLDVTERREAEAVLRETEQRLRLAIDGGRIGTWDWDLVTLRGAWSVRTQEILGIPKDAGITPAERGRTIHPDDRAWVAAELMRAMEHEDQFTTEYRIVRPDGEVRWVASRGIIQRDEAGRPIRTTGTVRDVTERRHAQEALTALNQTLELKVAQRTAEREQAQEALRQAQKMEALGQLTGGVAHDFNNLLTPILGSLDLLQRKGVGDERSRRLIDGALQSAERARVLVQRLLAFARRQPLQVRAVDLTALVAGLADLLDTTLGPRIAVRIDIASALPAVAGDPNQLEMALINLAVNARDAMVDGGALTIAAASEVVAGEHRARLAPGAYVRLSVVDTGTGMDEATLTRAVEPFFSTKGIGKGTGLGLSMVEGLTAQLGGGIAISSRVGIGTNIELWLPVAAPAIDTAAPADATSVTTTSGRILLVDDEPLVRATSAAVLEDLGYHVTEAESAIDALALLDGGLAVDLLLTDHLMPRMTGTDLAREVRRRLPRMKILIISGYAETAELAPDLPHLAKPFRPADLAEKLGAL